MWKIFEDMSKYTKDFEKNLIDNQISLKKKVKKIFKEVFENMRLKNLTKIFEI